MDGTVNRDISIRDKEATINNNNEMINNVIDNTVNGDINPSSDKESTINVNNGMNSSVTDDTVKSKTVDSVIKDNTIHAAPYY